MAIGVKSLLKKQTMKNIIFHFVCVILFFSIGCAKTQELKVQQTEKPTTSGTVLKDTLPKTTETVPATISGLVYGIKDIPKDIKYDGKVIASAKWSDKNGDNVIVITETDVKTTEIKSRPDDPELSKWLYGYHYVSNKLLWKIQDFVDQCPAALDLTYIQNSLTITDINNNGIAESTFLYMLGCRGDVSPVGLKLMMHEKDIKYALRGETFIKYENVAEGGDIKEVDPSFKKAPDSFLDYAKKQWEKFKTEKLGN